MIEDFEKVMVSEFEMTDLGLMKYFLGMKLKKCPGHIFISWEKYEEDLLKKFNMLDLSHYQHPWQQTETF